MRICNRAILAALVLVLPAVTAAQDGAQLINVPLSRPGEPINLEIGILSARIEVIGEDRDDAQFEVKVVDGQRRIVTPSGTKTITGGGYALEVDEKDNNISVDTDWRANKVSVVARIPRVADLSLSTTNDGEIIVSNVTGALQLSNTNGPITASDIRGSVIAESINDTVIVSMREIDDSQAMALSTISGDVELALPENAAVQLHIDSSHGEIYSDFEVDVQATKPTIERNDKRGGVEVRVENVIVANVNGGGPVVRLKSLNGDIRISQQ